MSRAQTIRRLQTELDRTREAIKQVEENGQSFALDGVTHTRGTLSVLLAREARLEKKIGRAKGTRSMVSNTRFGGSYL